MPKDVIEKVKNELFDLKASKEVLAARKTLSAKAKTYYSNEALNPRPKRGRPPKQIAKSEVEPQMTTDRYLTVTPFCRPFLFMPDYAHGSFIIFSQKFENQEQLIARKKLPSTGDFGVNMESLNQKLSAIRNLSNRWAKEEQALKNPSHSLMNDEETEEDLQPAASPKKSKPSATAKKPLPKKKEKLPQKKPSKK